MRNPPPDLFGRVNPPPELQTGIKDPERARRVRLLAECFEALLRGELPSLESRLFVASGGLAWLELGGSLDGDHWRVRAPNGSHHGPRYVLRLLRETSSKGETPSQPVGTIVADDDPEGTE